MVLHEDLDLFDVAELNLCIVTIVLRLLREALCLDMKSLIEVTRS